MATQNQKTALIVGASRGLGLGLVREYLDRGWHVVGTVRDKAKPSELHDLQSDSLTIETADVTDRTSIANLKSSLADRKLDLLFVNAGIANDADKTIDTISTEEFNHVLDTNALGPLQTIETLASLVTEQGTIAVMSSGLGSVSDNTSGGWETYRASKAALNTLTISYAHRAQGARSILVMSPGWVKTDMGGPNASLDVATSVRGMADVIAAHEGKKTVAFLSYNGKIIPW